MCQRRMQGLSHSIYPEFYIVTVIIIQDFQNVSNEMACADWETVTVYMGFPFRVESNILGCSGGKECNVFIFPYFWNVIYYFVQSSLYVLFWINNSHEAD